MALIAVALSGCLAAVPERSPAEEGRLLADRMCGGCHAVELADASEDPRAPPLRDLFRRYAIDDLRRAFLGGIHVGDPEMPTFRLAPDEVDRLLVYLRSLDPCAQSSSDRAAMERCFAPL